MRDQRLARLQVRPAPEAEPRGLVRDDHRGGPRVVDGVGKWQAVAGLGDGDLGQGAMGEGGKGGDAIADGDVVDAGPDGTHGAAQLEAGGERQRRPLLVAPPAEQDVGEVQAGRRGRRW